MVAVGRISLILSNRRPQVFFCRTLLHPVLRWPYQQCFKQVIVNCQVSPLVFFIFLWEYHSQRDISQEISPLFLFVCLLFPLRSFFVVEFGLAICKEETTGGSQFWTVTRSERKRGPIRTWPSKTLQDFLLLSPEEYLQVQGAAAGPLELFFSSSLAPVASEVMVAAPQIRATLSECLAFFAGEHFDLWSRKTRTAAASNPFHMEICASVVLQILKTGTRALLVFHSINLDFIYSRKCVSISQNSLQYNLFGVMWCCASPCRLISHRHLTRNLVCWKTYMYRKLLFIYFYTSF